MTGRTNWRVLVTVVFVVAGCTSNSVTGTSARLVTPHPIGWAARTCASALQTVHTGNVLAEAYSTAAAVYLLSYRTEENRFHPQKQTHSAFRTLGGHHRIAFCVTVTPEVAQIAHGQPRKNCPLGSLPDTRYSDDAGEQFYATDAALTSERVNFAPPPDHDTPGCFAGRL